MRITERKLRKIIRENISGNINTIEAAKKAFIESPKSCIYNNDQEKIMHITEMPGYIKEVRALYNDEGKLVYWNIVYHAMSHRNQFISNSQNEDEHDSKTQYILDNLSSGCWLYQIDVNSGHIAEMSMEAGNLYSSGGPLRR
jgi:hypothetical protein